MAATVNTVTLHPGDGWVQLCGAVTNFLRISHFPHHVPIFITVAASPPTGTPQGGFRIAECSTHFDGAISGNVYGRISNNSNDNVSVSVFQN